MGTAIRPRPKVVTANLAVGLLAPVAGVAAIAARDARVAMLAGAWLLGWSQLVGL